MTVWKKRLYDLVWSMPLQQIAKEIGMSDVGISKICRREGIPVPPRGYWAKLEAAKPVTPLPLPRREAGERLFISVPGKFASVLPSWLQDDEYLVVPEFEDIEAMVARYKKRLGKVTVPRDFTKAHRDIRKLLDKDEDVRTKSETERFYWRKPVFDDPFERRRLRIINALFIAAARVGGGGWVRGENAREHAVTIGDIGLHFTLDRIGTPRGRCVDHEAKSDALRLSLDIYEPPPNIKTSWSDEDGSKLESRMAEIMLDLGITVEKIQRHRLIQTIEREHQRRIEREEERRRQQAEEERLELERQEAIAQAKRDALLSDANAFEDARRIRLYIDAIARSVSDPNDRDFIDWARWAREEADRLDPITSGRVADTIANHNKQ